MYLRVLDKMDKHINLLDYRKKRYSSIGNDGIIRYILKKINIKNGIFVEFGAWDGIKNSNCRKLFDEGWEGIFIESNFDRYEKLKNNYKEYKRIICSNKRVLYEGDDLFDNIVDPYLKGKNIDFCSIDIDGLDLEVFETFEKYLPTVVCIEGGQMLHPYHKRIKKEKAEQNMQQSLKIMVDSFEKKGYKILCSCQDSFFVKKEFYKLFNVSSDLLTLYFNGLRAMSRRMPFIQKFAKRVGMNNNIVNFILKKSKYKEQYKWTKRKKWAIDKKDIINRLLNEVEDSERRKRI